MSHTPGPWVYRDGLILAPEATDGFGVCPVDVIDPTGAMGGDDTEADLRLIAAAPTMLEALKAVVAVDGILGTNYTDYLRAMSTARAAIRQATGEGA